MKREERLKYVWHTESGKNSCSECDALDGEEFDDESDIPDYQHPTVLEA